MNGNSKKNIPGTEIPVGASPRNVKGAHKGPNVALISVIAVLVVAIAACGVMLYHMNSKPAEEVPAYMQELNKIDEMSDEEKQAAIDTLVDESSININYTTQVKFDTNGVAMNFKVRNIENNHDSITFKIFGEGGETLFESQEIPRGYEMTNIKLNEPLAVGVHSCRISIAYVGGGNVSSSFPLEITVVEPGSQG